MLKKQAYIIIPILTAAVLSCAGRTKQPITHSTHIKLPKVKNRPEAEFVMAKLAEEQGDLKKAIIHYKKAEQSTPNSAAIQMNLARALMTSGKLEEAEIHAKKAIKLLPSDPDPYILMGKIKGLKGDIAAATNMFKKAIKAAPNNEEPYLALFNLFLAIGDLNEAENTLKQLVKKRPGSFRGFYYLGRTCVEKRKFKEAIKWYKKSVEVSPGWIYGWYALALVQEHIGMFNEALDALEHVLNLDPQNTQVMQKEALILQRQGKHKKAEYIYKKAFEITGNAGYLLRIGLMNLENNDVSGAAEAFEEIKKLYPKDKSVHYYFLLLEEKKGNPDKMAKHLYFLPPSSPMYTEAAFRTAMAFETKGKTTKAQKLLEQTIKKADNPTDLLILLARIKSTHGKTKESVKLLQNAVLQNRGDKISLMYQQAFFILKTGDRKGAIKKAEEILKIDPKNADALNFIGYTLVEAGKELDRAEKYIQKAVSLRPESGYILDSMGWLMFKKGNYKKAVKILSAAAKMSPNEPMILEHLADAYMARAKEIYAKPTKIEKKNVTLEKIQISTSHLEKKLNKKPNDPTLKAEIATNYLLIAEKLYKDAVTKAEKIQKSSLPLEDDDMTQLIKRISKKLSKMRKL